MKPKFIFHGLLAALCQLSSAADQTYIFKAGEVINIFMKSGRPLLCIKVDSNNAIKQIAVHLRPYGKRQFFQRIRNEQILKENEQNCYFKKFNQVEFVALQDSSLTVITNGEENIDFLLVVGDGELPEFAGARTSDYIPR